MPAASSVKTWPSTHKQAAVNSWAPGIQTLLGRYVFYFALATKYKRQQREWIRCGCIPANATTFHEIILTDRVRDCCGECRTGMVFCSTLAFALQLRKIQENICQGRRKTAIHISLRYGGACCNNFHGLCSSRGHTSWFSLYWRWRQQAILPSTRRPTTDTWISINTAVKISVSPEDSHLRFGEKEIKSLSETSPERETDDLWISRTSGWQHNPLTITAIK